MECITLKEADTHDVLGVQVSPCCQERLHRLHAAFFSRAVQRRYTLLNEAKQHITAQQNQHITGTKAL